VENGDCVSDGSKRLLENGDSISFSNIWIEENRGSVSDGLSMCSGERRQCIGRTVYVYRKTEILCRTEVNG
jgi:hypothetical protein